MRMGRKAIVGALALAVAVGLGWATAGAEDPKPAPTKVTIGVKGLDTQELQKGLDAGLKPLEAVEASQAEAEKVTIQLRAEKTLKLSEVAAVVKALSTEAKPLAVDAPAIALTGTVGVTLVGTDGQKDEDVIKALQSAPNVEKVAGAGAKYDVSFKGAQGATVGDLVKALKTALGAKEDGSVPGVGDVAWTAPKAGDGKEGSHG